jgi:hypothetical protein
VKLIKLFYRQVSIFKWFGLRSFLIKLSPNSLQIVSRPAQVLGDLSGKLVEHNCWNKAHSL